MDNKRRNPITNKISQFVKGNKTLIINEADRLWLAQMELESFEQLMFGDQGSVIEKNNKADIRKIEGHGRTAYLKRRLTSPIRESVEKYLLDRCAHCAPFTEYLHILSLQKFQFPVMNVIAVGEYRRLGFPGYGFILVDEVKGSRLDEVMSLRQTDDTELHLLKSFGKLLAELHRNGFYSSLRLKDIIVSDISKASLVMIDRETRHPKPRRQSRIKAQQSLDRSFRRIKRDMSAFDHNHIDIVMQSYRDSFQAKENEL